MASTLDLLFACVQEAVRLIQSARREGNSGRVDPPLAGRLAEMEALLTAELNKANRMNGSVYLQVSALYSKVQGVPCVRAP